MPELPEVELNRRVVEYAIKTLSDGPLESLTTTPRLAPSVDRVELTHCKIFTDSAKELQQHLIDARLVGTLRHGKIMGLVFDRVESICILITQLGMTGRWHYLSTPDIDPPKGTKLTLHLNGQARSANLCFVNFRLFGRVQLHTQGRSESLVSDAQELWRTIISGHQIGPDMLTISPTDFSACFNQSPKRRIKDALLDQKRVAGIGNIYAVEGLFAAKVNPIRYCSQITPREWFALHEGITQSMQGTLSRFADDELRYGEAKGEKSPFSVYGRAGLPCVQCNTPIVQKKQGGRSTAQCPDCQKR